MSSASSGIGRARRTVALAVAVVLAAGLLAGCGSSGSDGGGEGSGTTTTAAAGGGSGSTTTEAATTTTADSTTSSAPAGGGDLEGAWVADAQSLLTANTANLGNPQMDCSGPITLTFGADGHLSQQGTATCTIAGQSATLRFANTADYSVSGNEVSITGTSSDSSVTVAGVTRPTTIGLGSNTATFDVSGNTLKLTFTIAPTGTVTQTYTRS